MTEPYAPTLRDKIVVLIANAILRLATQGYRDCLNDVVGKGLDKRWLNR
jgi:hypothetical protein